MKKLIRLGIATMLMTSALVAKDETVGNPSDVKGFDDKMIKIQYDMVSRNKNFKVNGVSILAKKKIDNKWTMYTFGLDLTNKAKKKKFKAPLIIFTDGKYETNSLTDMKTGVRYEILEQQRMQKESRGAQKLEREKFEKSFTLNPKYYNDEHLLLGDKNAKHKVVFVSDPLCVACIGSFPSIYNSLKGKKDFALYYYHYPLKRLHPTAEIIAKAMKQANKDGVKDVEITLYKANIMKKFDVYKNKDESLAIKAFNEILGTKYKVPQIDKLSVDADAKIADDVKLTGTPTVVLDGSLVDSRKRLGVLLQK